VVDISAGQERRRVFLGLVKSSEKAFMHACNSTRLLLIGGAGFDVISMKGRPAYEVVQIGQ
jgi:hypothetical protein